MSNKYRNSMDKIVMDEDMKNRIMLNLQNINKDDIPEVTIKRNPRNMVRNLGLYAACAAFVMSIGVMKTNIRLPKLQEINEEIVENPIGDYVEDKEFALNEEVPQVESVKDIENVQRNVPDVVEKEKSPNNNSIRNSYAERKPETSNIENKKVISEEKVIEESPKYEIISDSDNMDNNLEVIPESNENSMIIALNDDIQDDSTSSEIYIRSGNSSFDNLDELQKEAGFEFKVSSYLENNYNRDEMNLVLGNVVEITYVNKDESINFKTCEGENRLNSSYDLAQKSVNHNDINYKLQSEADNIKSVLWNENNASYSIECEAGLNEERALKMAQDLKTIN